MEPGPGGWGSATDEQAYISAAINFYANVNVSPANRYFSIFGEHYFVGYGAAFHGLAALLAMLNSCASGVGVVNIDNGFGAAHLACLILKGRAIAGRP